MKLRFSFLILFFSLAMPAQEFDMDLVRPIQHSDFLKRKDLELEEKESLVD